MLRAQERAEQVPLHGAHEGLSADVREEGRRVDPGVGEHNIEAAEALYGVFADGRDGGLGGGVEFAGEDLARGVEGAELADVHGQVGRVVVAEVEGAGAVASEVVGSGAADAEGRVGA